MATSGQGHLSSFSILVRSSNQKEFLYLVPKLVSMGNSNLELHVITQLILFSIDDI